MASVSETLHRALEHHRAGDLSSAENLYREIVRFDPTHADALHLLGVAAHQRRQHGPAVDFIQRAIAANDSTPAYYSNLAAAYRSLGQLDDAVAALERALHLSPDFADAHYNLGTVYQEREKLDKAIDCFRRTIELSPEHAEAWNNLGIVYGKQGEISEAIQCYRKALSIRPQFAEAYNNLGTAQFSLSKFDEAAANHRRAIELRPDYAEAQFNLGNALKARDDFEQAAACYLQAVRIDPHYADARLNLGVAMKELGRFDEALACYEQVLSKVPESAEAHVNRAFVRRLLGVLPAGWEEYEWRWKVENLPRRYRQPTWDGSDLDGKTILVFAEQGVGDEIMFASCIPDVCERAAGCLVECDQRLVPLFARSFPSAQVFASPADPLGDPPAALPKFDVQAPMGSLPRYLRPTMDAFPTRKGFLRTDEQRRAKWRSRLQAIGGRLTVGISWRGGRKPETQRARSTTLEQWLAVFGVSNVSFINLQYGDCRDELQALYSLHGVRVHDWDDVDALENLDEFAAQISALDLVVSIDNSTVHLAGALGVPVWTLLPAVPDWRWLLDCDDSPWYPSMRLYRQRERGRWDDVFQRVGSELATMATRGAGRATLIGESKSLCEEGASNASNARAISTRRRDSEIPRRPNPADNQWLAQNKTLRMDANSSLFRESRRNFHLSRYRFAADYCAGKKVLDAACGTGYGSALLAESAAEVTGIDFSTDAVEYARRVYGSERVHFAQSCVESAPFPSATFDVVVSFETLEHLISPRSALIEFARLLRDDGTAVLSVPNAWGLTPHHFHDLDYDKLQELAAQFFQQQEFFYNNSGDKKGRTPPGIGRLDAIKPCRAECIVAVCRGPRKDKLPEDQTRAMLADIYEAAFRRHREFLDLRWKSGDVFPMHFSASVPLPVAHAGGTISLAADGLPAERGRVLLRMEADVADWRADHLTVALPAIQLERRTAAQLQIVLDDGRVAASPLLRITTADIERNGAAGSTDPSGSRFSSPTVRGKQNL